MTRRSRGKWKCILRKGVAETDSMPMRFRQPNDTSFKGQMDMHSEKRGCWNWFNAIEVSATKWHVVQGANWKTFWGKRLLKLAHGLCNRMKRTTGMKERHSGVIQDRFRIDSRSRETSLTSRRQFWLWFLLSRHSAVDFQPEFRSLPLCKFNRFTSVIKNV